MKEFKISFLTLIISLFFVYGMAQTTENLSPELIDVFKTGNSLNLTNYFSDHVELMIDDREDIYSKSQAAQIMASFFRKYPPTNFSVKHVGSQNNTRYVIGTLFAENITFRINFLLRKLNGKLIIHQLHIEAIGDQ